MRLVRRQVEEQGGAAIQMLVALVVTYLVCVALVHVGLVLYAQAAVSAQVECGLARIDWAQLAGMDNDLEQAADAVRTAIASEGVGVDEHGISVHVKSVSTQNVESTGRVSGSSQGYTGLVRVRQKRVAVEATVTYEVPAIVSGWWTDGEDVVSVAVNKEVLTQAEAVMY